MKKNLKKGVGVFFEYETEKIVQINSKKVGIINRLLQCFIIGYIIGWVIIYKKGYQDFDPVVSSVTTKVKGIQYRNLSNITGIGARIYDVADYIIPPQENNAFFIMTNAIVTPLQRQGVCPEDPNVYMATCSSDNDCPAYGEPMKLGNGVATGRCVNSSLPSIKTCEIISWCPTEFDVLPLPHEPIISNVKNFTILIKNNIEFPLFKQKKRNILDWMTKTYLSNCEYDASHSENLYCPIFNIGYILNEIDNKVQILMKGGVIGIYINWDCNLDWSMNYCNPQYTFRRLDEENAKIAKGWNFRYANYYYVNGTEHRTLIKAYGLRFIVFVTGQAGKFNIIPLTMNVGSGLALLGLATVLCDMIVLSVLSRKNQYRNAKFQTLEDEDAYKNLMEKNPANYSTTKILDEETPQRE